MENWKNLSFAHLQNYNMWIKNLETSTFNKYIFNLQHSWGSEYPGGTEHR